MFFEQLPQGIYAAGEVWTWQKNGTITVTGGNLQDPATIATDGAGNLDVKDPNGAGGFCVLSVLTQLAANDGSATIEGGFNLPGAKTQNACPAAIQNEYYGTKVQIAGTPPNAAGGGGLGAACAQGEYEVEVTFYEDKIVPAPPDRLTFVIGNQMQTSPSFRENDAFGNNYSYTATFCEKPGTYQVSAEPLLKLQKPFTVKNATVTLVYGNRMGSTSNVDVSIILVNSDGPGPYAVQLQQGGKTIQTVQTTKAGNQGTGCALELETTFYNVKPGGYEIAVPHFNFSIAFTQNAGQAGFATLNISMVETNGQNVCAKNYQNPTEGPPPPLPPCMQWANGVCETFDSTFGGFSTNPTEFIQKIFAILLSVSGGIALLLIIKAGYQLMTSQGNPEKLNNARDQLIAAIVGLVFLIFAFVFLELIGFDILHLPGFGGTAANAGAGAACQPGTCIPEATCTAKNPGECNTNGCAAGDACVQQ